MWIYRQMELSMEALTRRYVHYRSNILVLGEFLITVQFVDYLLYRYF